MSVMTPTLPYSFKLTLWNRIKMSGLGVFVGLFGVIIFYVGYPTKDLVALISAGFLFALGLGLIYLMFSRPSDTVVVSDSGILTAFAVGNAQKNIPWDDITGFLKVKFRNQEFLVISTKSAAAQVEQNAIKGIANYAAGLMTKGGDAAGVSIPDMWLGMKVDKAIEILEAIHNERKT